MKGDYLTLSEAVNSLQKLGYTYNFNVQDTVLYCNEHHLQLTPSEFNIDRVFRFEGETDPGDENILYAISAPERNIRGLLVNAYGPYNDSVSSEIVAKLSVREANPSVQTDHGKPR
jgi:hypothetical protein